MGCGLRGAVLSCIVVAMIDHRKSRLSLLTKGAALVGIGMAAACAKEPGPVNGPDPNAVRMGATAEPAAADAATSPAIAPTNSPAASAAVRPDAVLPTAVDAGSPVKPTINSPPSAFSGPISSPPPVDAGALIKRPIMNAPPKAMPQ